MRVIAIMGVVGLGLGPVVCAQSPDNPQSAASSYLDAAAGLTLDEAIARALEHEPSLQAARTDVDAARGMRVQAGLRPNPAVSFSQQNEPGGTDSQTRVEVQWPLDLFRRAGRAAVADREIGAARQAAADREWALAGDVRLKYGEVVAAVRALEVADEVLSATGRQLSLVSSRVAEGGVPPLERDILRVEAQRLAADRILQAGQAERAFLGLKRLLGLPAEAPLTLRDPLEQLVQREAARPLPGDAAAAMTRPDVLEAGSKLDLAGAQIDRARREGRPEVSLFGMFMRMDAGFSQRGVNALGDLERVRGVFRYFSAGAMVVLPLQNRNQGEIAAGRARQQGAEARLRAVRLTAASEIAAARVRDDRARQALAAYAADTRTLARRNLEVVRQTYELGRVTLFDVLNEQRRYLDTERAYTDTLREAYEAREGLMQALGEFR